MISNCNKRHEEEGRQSAVGTGQDADARLGLWEPQPPGRSPRLGRALGPQAWGVLSRGPIHQPQRAEGRLLGAGTEATR